MYVREFCVRGNERRRLSRWAGTVKRQMLRHRRDEAHFDNISREIRLGKLAGYGVGRRTYVVYTTFDRFKLRAIWYNRDVGSLHFCTILVFFILGLNLLK